MSNSTLGVLLNLGESFTSLGEQAGLMLQQNIARYSRAFSRVYIFTYLPEKMSLPKNCILITPPIKLHRYLYALLLPLIHRHLIRKLNLLRCFQLAGTLPAIIAKLVFAKKFVFNYGYDYAALAAIEGKPIQSRLFRCLKPFAIALADFVIYKIKSAYHISPKSIYLPNGVNLRQFYPRRHHLSHPPLILFVGRLEPQKNLLNLIKACQNLKVKLLFIGNGSLFSPLLSLSQKLNVNLTIKSKIVHSQLPKIYQAADIFVLPSKLEGSPKALLEAMACGLPCLASNIYEHQEIIKTGYNGILCPPTAIAIKKGLQRLLSQRALRQHLGQHARKTIIKQFNEQKILNQEVQILSHLSD